MKHLENYRNNLIKVIPSKITTFWFTLYINGSNEGDYRSEELAIEEGRELIDNVINQLKIIDPDTVIDNNWKDYLVKDKNNSILNSLLLLTGYKDYDEVSTMFEGYKMEKFMEKYLDNNQLIKISGYWKDNNQEFNDYIVSQYDDILDENDDNIFYYGLSLNFIINNLNETNNGLEFVITSYSLV